jgi:hypothetical protein
MVNDTLPTKDEVEVRRLSKRTDELSFVLSRKGQDEAVRAVWRQGEKFDGTVVVWIDPNGAVKGPDIENAAVLTVDVLGTGSLKLPKGPQVDGKFAGYTFGYNRSLLANRVHDILTAVAFARGREGVKKVMLVGTGQAGPWVLLARGLCGDAVTRTAADVDGFRFEKVRTNDDEMMLPGALKYGGLPALAGLAAPGELFVWNVRGSGSGKWLKPVYKAAGDAEKLKIDGESVELAKVVEWLLR